MTTQCLVLETKDNRKFLVDEDNFSQLIEFSKTFGAEISIVEVEKEECEILNLEQLAPKLCDPTYKVNPKYTLVEKKTPEPSKNDIRNYIYEKFINKEEVSARDLKSKWPNENSYNHLYYVIKNMKKQGHQISRIAKGVYKVQ